MRFHAIIHATSECASQSYNCPLTITEKTMLSKIQPKNGNTLVSFNIYQVHTNKYKYSQIKRHIFVFTPVEYALPTISIHGKMLAHGIN